MIWFGKSFIKFCKSFINLIKLVSTLTFCSARVRIQAEQKFQSNLQRKQILDIFNDCQEMLQIIIKSLANHFLSSEFTIWDWQTSFVCAWHCLLPKLCWTQLKCCPKSLAIDFAVKSIYFLRKSLLHTRTCSDCSNQTRAWTWTQPELCCLTNGLLRLYLLQNPWINFVGFKFFLDQLKMQKLRTGSALKSLGQIMAR